jgi:hypothetical protein
MNAKPVLAAVVVALVGSVAMASEEMTTFNDPAPTRARVDVKAELVRAQADGTLFVNGEASRFAERQPTPTLVRADVKAEARTYARNHTFIEVYGAN